MQDVTNPDPDAAKGFRVLLVEDENVIRMILAEALRDAGFQVTDAESGVRALALLAPTQDFDLLLTDVQMPGGVSGLDLAREIRARWPQVPVVFVTGRPDVMPAPAAGGFGPRDRLVVKPCRSSTLLHAVRSSLAA